MVSEIRALRKLPSGWPRRNSNSSASLPRMGTKAAPGSSVFSHIWTVRSRITADAVSESPSIRQIASTGTRSAIAVRASPPPAATNSSTARRTRFSMAGRCVFSASRPTA